MNRQINIVDYQNSILNSQIHIDGAFSDIDSDYIYFILNISGTSVILKDANSVTKRTFTVAQDFHFGLRLDGGIDISGTAPSVTYIKVKK